MDWSVGLTVCFWSHRSSFGLLWCKLFSSVWFGLFWLVCFGLLALVCTALVFSRLYPPGRFCSGLVFHIAPVVLDPISYHLFCSAQVQSTLSCSHSFGSSFCLGLLWSKLFSSVWFGLFWLVCSGSVPLVCTAPVFSRLCPPGRFWPGLVFRVSNLVLDPMFSDMFCSALVWSILSFLHWFGRSASFWAGLVRLCPVRFAFACFGLVCDALLHTVYSCSFVLVTVARI